MYVPAVAHVCRLCIAAAGTRSAKGVNLPSEGAGDPMEPIGRTPLGTGEIPRLEGSCSAHTEVARESRARMGA
jgi:hypothetical protein